MSDGVSGKSANDAPPERAARFRGLPLLFNLGLLTFGAILVSGLMFSRLFQWRTDTLYKRQVNTRVTMITDSVRTRVASLILVNDFEHVDRIMRDSFGYDPNIVDAMIVRKEDNRIYYDISNTREGNKYSSKMHKPGAVYITRPVVLAGGMGFIVPPGDAIGSIIVGYRQQDAVTDEQLKAIVEYSRTVMLDISDKLAENQLFAARSILANMYYNSENIIYVQWIDQDGMIRAQLDNTHDKGGPHPREGTRITESVERKAMEVSVRKPVKIQQIDQAHGRRVYDIAMPLIRNGKRVGVVRMGYVNPEFLALQQKSRQMLWIVMGGFLATGLMFAFAVGWTIARPVQRLAAASRRAATGDLDQQVDVRTGGTEIMRLAEDFNLMMRRRRDAEIALRESEAKFRRLAENAPDIILRWSPGFGVEYANPAIQEITGFAPDEIIGRPGFLISQLLPEDQAVFSSVITSPGALNGTPRPAILRLRTKSETVKYLEAQFIPIRDDEGDVISLECIARDITERLHAEQDKEKLQEQLLQMQKMEAVGQLAGGIAHDFNNMLTVVMANADLGLIYADKGTRFNQYFKDIMLATERARNLTMKLLTFARKEKVNVQDIRISAAVQELMAMLERSVHRNVHLVTRIEDDTLVRVDVTQIQQALLNICTNAVDSMPDGGALSVVCREVELTEKDCRGHSESRPGTFCMVRISDTGVGIPPEILPKVFEPFFTTKGVGKGTGLGLSTTHGILTSHNGHMTIESQSGSGTTVTMYIPAAVPSTGIAKTKSSKAAAAGGTETILLVDDEPGVLDATASILEQAGYSVLTAQSGRRAVEIFSRNRFDIRLVVCDMIMPDMDGEETYKALKQLDPDVAVVLASGYSIEGKAGALLADGVRGFVQKPFTYDVLCSTVRSVIDKS